jgi:hypothetical protein
MKPGSLTLAALAAAAVLLACAPPAAPRALATPGSNTGILGSGSIV